MQDLPYVLITPARNEEGYIAKTLDAVTRQTVLPGKWIIVSDNSEDGTDEIVRQYAASHTFITLLRSETGGARNFSAKVAAFNLALPLLENIGYDFIGIVDADISFDPDYYENILDKFRSNPKLGVAGGIRYDYCNGAFHKVLCSINSVGGPFQLFRRDCFEQIGGFAPIDLGGEDAVAEIKARMCGWQVRSYEELIVYHHKCTGSMMGNFFLSFYKQGQREYLIGYHPLFEIFRRILHLVEKPYVLGSLIMLLGYFRAYFSRHKPLVDRDVVQFLKEEQLGRLKSIFTANRDPLFRI
jgi:cellulose synthase/poly-beta-1,6-N-acetylglucosamine synthase-like glycosyltransferase